MVGLVRVVPPPLLGLKQVGDWQGNLREHQNKLLVKVCEDKKTAAASSYEELPI